MLNIEALEIDDQILDKIESNAILAFNEVEEACFSGKKHVRKSKEGLYKIFSRTVAGRYVLIVLANVADGIWKVVTARQMTDNERQLYTKSVGGK